MKKLLVAPLLLTSAAAFSNEPLTISKEDMAVLNRTICAGTALYLGYDDLADGFKGQAFELQSLIEQAERGAFKIAAERAAFLRITEMTYEHKGYWSGHERAVGQAENYKLANDLLNKGACSNRK